MVEKQTKTTIKFAKKNKNILISNFKIQILSLNINLNISLL